MRRRIELYIGGSPADLSDQNLILFNYAFTDAETPTAVKNSFSKQVTLPGTPANDAIFGHLYRLDRVTMASGFNALNKTPFVIFDERGNILESGYLRLDSVTRKGVIVTGYKVSLFGGLGSFFYALSYNDDGTKKSLASLRYLNTLDASTELDFVITRNAVSDAWTRLASNPASVSQKWDVLNFAPCYNGVPDGDFTPDLGYGNAAALGLSVPVGERTDANGNAYVKFSKAMDEWAVKDLRSYLQRPVLSWRAFLQAVGHFASDNGWTLDYSAVPSAEYADLWLTLPMLTSIAGVRQTGGTIVGTLTPYATTAQTVGRIDLSGLDTFVGVNIAARIYTNVLFDGSSLSGNARLLNNSGTEMSIVFYQVLAYSGNTLLGGSSVLMAHDYDIQPGGSAAVAQLASEVGYTPVVPTNEYIPKEQSLSDYWQGGAYMYDEELEFPEFQIEGADNYRIVAEAFHLTGTFSGSTISIDSVDADGSSVPWIWPDGSDTPKQVDTAEANQDYTTPDEYDYTSPGVFRSGVLLGKAEVLSSTATPLDYLIAWTKRSGLVFRYDPAAKLVTILPRDDFFGTGLPVLDLSERIDRSKEITIAPMYSGSRWYEFADDLVESGYAKEYLDTYGVQYGIQRMDTGYAFNADAKNLLDKGSIRAAVSRLAHGPYWNCFFHSSVFYPSQFAEAGHKYILFGETTGEEKEHDLPALDGVFSYYNNDFKGYDLPFISRLDFADGEGKALDGAGVLCWYEGVKMMPYFHLSDDDTTMCEGNKGTPCWWLTGGNSTGIAVPVFSRYRQEYNRVAETLDFGKPREADIPGVVFAEADCTMYERRWRAYLSDLLNLDTKVMKCRVDFKGLQVGPDLLRRFFWYEGSLWVLNKMTNYSLTTWDPVECEFIQVRDIEAYTNGQI